MSSREPVLILDNPRMDEDIENSIREALAQRKILLLIGNCWVDYKGRASSKLEPGERIVIIKEDGSVLVHRPSGYEAVNWQPPGCIFQSRVKDGILQITAVRRKPAESIRIYFNKIYLLSTMKLKDTGEFSLHASEEDMQKAILLKPSIIEEGFKPISYEKKVEPGFVDVYGIDREDKFVVVEIKRKTAGRNAALQLSMYVKAVQGIVNREVRGILAAPNIAKGTQRLLVTLGLSFKPLNPRKCAEILHKSQTLKLADFFEPSE
ncbi:MAG: endonuclease NucS [Candidatus Bathyarchaeota archaeon]|nr:endonuclease NucS [Candidatus Bathyarchaeota archaeon]MDH5495200.1 endonuclease NucS [Candidatus Bathyarchaeota archaeon]